MSAYVFSAFVGLPFVEVVWFAIQQLAKQLKLLRSYEGGVVVEEVPGSRTGKSSFDEKFLRIGDAAQGKNTFQVDVKHREIEST